MQTVMRNRIIRAVSELQHCGTIRAGGHVSANGMPDGARVVSFRVRPKRARTARTPPRSPFVMPRGEPGVVCPRSRYPNPSARDRGQRCKSPQVLLSVTFSAYSTKKLHVRT